jgi:hydrogenase maturation protein HypF
MHPLYRTNDLAKKYAEGAREHAPAPTSPASPSSVQGAGAESPSGSGQGIELLPVQHHHAHIASVMAEHGLAGPVIGVAFDGTGYGTDGTIWGGEILVCEGAEFERFSHLRDTDMIGGDESMKEGWKSAVCRIVDYNAQNEPAGAFATRKSTSPLRANEPASASAAQESTSSLRASEPEAASDRARCFDIDLSPMIEYAQKNDTLAGYEDERKAITAALAAGVNTVRTSSMGRLFDAVASLLGICHVNRYEGECAIMLENAAARVPRARDSSPGVYAPESNSDPEAAELALRFHKDIARAVLRECRKARDARGVDAVCLSGGVFQNRILTEEVLRLLRADGFRPYYNISVPPNDGGIALGQAYIAMRRIFRCSLPGR